MKKTYYIANIQFNVTSQIDLDEYENEAKFLTPVCVPERVVPVEVCLTSQILPVPKASTESASVSVPAEASTGSASVPAPVEASAESASVSAPVEASAEAVSAVKPADTYETAGMRSRIYAEKGETGLHEIRIYDLWDIYSNVIRCEYYNDRIRILIKDSIYKTVMHSFRIWSYMFLERILLEQNALILHSASIISQGRAVLFTAPSETGKTTQTDIWQRNEPTVTDLNGDRTILIKTADGWRACGIPISGTSERCEQIMAEIAGIAFVERAPWDRVLEMGTMEKLMLLYDQITVYDACPADAEKALELMEDLLANIRIVRLQCTMKDSAYDVLKQQLY